MRQIGQEVKIISGMREFIGQRGMIVDNNERDGRSVMYRVRLDVPVEVEGVGSVTDDLWQGCHLVNVASTTLKAARAELRPLGMMITKTDDEYRVTFKHHMMTRERAEAVAHYTNDLDDAVATGVDMAARNMRLI